MREHLNSKNSIKQNYKNLSCRFCNSKNIIKRGKRKTENRGKVQRYYCKACKKRFTQNDGFYRMRNNPLKITCCLDMYFRGVSLRKIQDHLKAFYPHNSSHMSILRWIRKYSLMISKFTDNLEVDNSRAITFDEIEFNTKGKRSFFIDVMDMNSRYILSSGYYPKRGMQEVREVLRTAKKKSKNKTTRFETDGLKVYPRALRKEYNYNKRNKDFIHKITTSSDKSFNWKIERLHNSIRERFKVCRNFGSLESARAIMKGYEIFYNFCRKHQGIKCYPYELAIPELKLGVNKWLELIKLSREIR